jgi:hypothetical protein
MSRGLAMFITFLVATGAALLVSVYLLGPNRLAFLLHEERHSAPFVMVNLLLPEHDADGAAIVGTMVDRLGGEVLWSATTDRVAVGTLNDAWPLIVLVTHPSRAQFVDQLGFRELRNFTGVDAGRLQRSAVLAATPQQHFEPGDATAFVLRAMIAADHAAVGVFDSEWLAQESRLARDHGGALMWHARLNPVATDAEHAFDYLLLFGFTDEHQRARWLDDTGRATIAALQSRLFRRDVLLLTAPAPGFVPPDIQVEPAPVDPLPPDETVPAVDTPTVPADDTPAEEAVEAPSAAPGS